MWFISAVLAHKWSSDLPHPDLEKMASESGITSRQLRRYRANLERKGYLEVRNRYDETGRQLSSSYDFSRLFDTLEQTLMDEPAPENEIRADEDYPSSADENREYSFVARYGRVIAAAGIAAIPQALFTYQHELRLSAAQTWFCCYILAHRWTTDLPYPSLRKMSERTGYSQQHLHDLKNSVIELGYLRVIGRLADNGRQDSNAYDFAQLFAVLVDRIEEAAPTNQQTPIRNNPSCNMRKTIRTRKSGQAASRS